MGLTESGAVFQRLVAETLTGLKGVITYLDNILVFGATKEEHDANLDAAFSRLASKDFRLQLKKCEFTVSTITFLGHVISGDGIEPDQKNVQPILSAPTLTTETQVKSWISMVGFYSDFLPDLATVAEPLHRLQR